MIYVPICNLMLSGASMRVHPRLALRPLFELHRRLTQYRQAAPHQAEPMRGAASLKKRGTIGSGREWWRRGGESRVQE